jgi:hypothetical protein
LLCKETASGFKFLQGAKLRDSAATALKLHHEDTEFPFINLPGVSVSYYLREMPQGEGGSGSLSTCKY